MACHFIWGCHYLSVCTGKVAQALGCEVDTFGRVHHSSNQRASALATHCRRSRKQATSKTKPKTEKSRAQACAHLPTHGSLGTLSQVDVILIGAGIMSATVGLMLKDLEPDWKMMMSLGHRCVVWLFASKSRWRFLVYLVV